MIIRRTTAITPGIPRASTGHPRVRYSLPKYGGIVYSAQLLPPEEPEPKKDASS